MSTLKDLSAGEYTESPYAQWLKQGEELEGRVKKMQEVKMQMAREIVEKEEEERRKEETKR